MSKKILALISAGILACALLALVGCGSSDEPAPAEGEGDGVVYTVATDNSYYPFSYVDADSGEPAGVDIDLVNAIAEVTGIQVKFEAVGFDAALQNVQTDQMDLVAAGCSIKPDRAEVMDFSDPYYNATICFAVAEDSDIASLEDLAGKTVATKNGTNSREYAESVKDQYGFETVVYEDSDTMYQAVMTGAADACFEDTPVMANTIKDYDNITLKVAYEVTDAYVTDFGFAVNKGKNAELLAAVNEGLQTIKDNGTYDEILAKYFA